MDFIVVIAAVLAIVAFLWASSALLSTAAHTERRPTLGLMLLGFAFAILVAMFLMNR